MREEIEGLREKREKLKEYEKEKYNREKKKREETGEGKGGEERVKKGKIRVPDTPPIISQSPPPFMDKETNACK